MRAYAVVKRSQRLIGETELRRGVVVFCSPCLGIRKKKGLVVRGLGTGKVIWSLEHVEIGWVWLLRGKLTAAPALAATSD